MTRLIDRSVVAENTCALKFEKPDGFSFLAGQYVLISQPQSAPYTDDGNSRYLSVASAPRDADISVVIRMRDTAFKQFLATSPIGTHFSIGEARGKLVIDHERKGLHVCIAGGVGITPFMSILKDATSRDKKADYLLLHSNRSPQTAIFLDDLRSLAVEHPWFQFVPTMTRLGVNDFWDGEIGQIDEVMVRKYVPSTVHAHFLVAGTHDFVVAMKKILQHMSIADTAIRTEEFCGYDGFRCPHCAEAYATRLDDTA
ncbi:MAG: FAD-dependent oxidoreductase [Minisyncoccia bacterium]